MLSEGEQSLKKARVGILGLTFKENVPDLRNSKIPDIVAELKQYGIQAMVHDPHGDPEEARHEYGIEITSLDKFRDLDVIFFAVSHKEYMEDARGLLARVKDGGIVIDVKSCLDARMMSRGLRYWSL
jgi:UDP-N-acetyl-D-galactosamine dehydrogenase